MTDELAPLSRKHQRVLDEYLICFSQWKAYKAAYPNVTDESARTLSSKLFANVDFLAHLTERLNEVHMSADEALKLLADIGHSDHGVFWKIVDEWVFNPLPEYEILAEQEVVDDTKDPPEKRISYRVRHAVLDMDRILDPHYSWMIKSFSNSRKFGLKIETYDKHAAIRDILKVHGKFTDRVDVTSGGEKIRPEEMKPSEIAERVAALLKGKDANGS